MVEWPRGEARDCKSLYTGSNPVSTSRVNFQDLLAQGLSYSIAHETFLYAFDIRISAFVI